LFTSEGTVSIYLGWHGGWFMIHKNLGNGFLGTWGIGWAETVVILELMIRTIMSGYRMQEQIILADMYKSVHRSSFGRVFRFCEPSQVDIPLS
jgi:hypothetical protein